jgi:hypothetical protein
MRLLVFEALGVNLESNENINLKMEDLNTLKS